MAEFSKTETQCRDIIKWIAKSTGVVFQNTDRLGNPHIIPLRAIKSPLSIAVQFTGSDRDNSEEESNYKEQIDALCAVITEVNTGMSSFVVDLRVSDKHPNIVIFYFANNEIEKIWRHLKTTPLRPAKKESRRDLSGSPPL